MYINRSGSLGWSGLPQQPTCSGVPDGQQQCFREAEQEFAIASGCVPVNTSCQTTAGSSGKIWCCPPGWPRPAGSAPIAADIKPPMPPFAGVMSILSRDWWFWVGAVSTGALAFFALQEAGKKAAIRKLRVWRS
jgi:hypothetical protein